MIGPWLSRFARWFVLWLACMLLVEALAVFPLRVGLERSRDARLSGVAARVVAAEGEIPPGAGGVVFWFAAGAEVPPGMVALVDAARSGGLARQRRDGWRAVAAASAAGVAVVAEPEAGVHATVEVARAVWWVGGSALLLIGGLGRWGWRSRRQAPAQVHVPPPDQRADPRWLAGVLGGLREGVIAFDRRGRIAFANQAAVRLLGRRALPEGSPMVIFADVPGMRTVTVAALRGEAGERELAIPGPPVRDVLLRAAPVDGGAIVMLFDVTALRAAERAQRNVVADLSHELRTPLAVMLNNSEMLLDPQALSPDQSRDLLEAIARNAMRLHTLSDALLHLARVEGRAEPLERDDVDLAPALGLLAQDVMQAQGAEGRIVVDIPPGCAVRADPVALDQAVTNLLTNALVHTEGPVRVSAERKPDRVVLRVSDTGEGLPEAVRDRLGERFSRGAPRADGKSIGLGLYIARRLVEAHGGRLWAEPNHPCGTVFLIMIPDQDTSAR